MGCSGSKAGGKAPAKNAKNVKDNKSPAKPPSKPGKALPIDKATLDMVHKKDAKESKIKMDIEYMVQTRNFIDKVAGGKVSYERLPSVDSISVVLGKKDKAQYNTKLEEVIKYNFPIKTGKLEFKNNDPRNPQKALSYVEAVQLSKMAVTDYVSFKNLVICSKGFGVILDTFAETKHIEFYACSFESISNAPVNATLAHKTETISVIYCGGVTEDTVGHFVTAVAKNKNLVASLKTINFENNKLKSDTGLKDALAKATIKAKLYYKESSAKENKAKKGQNAKSESGDEEELSDEEGEDDDEDADEEEAEDDEEEGDEDSDY